MDGGYDAIVIGGGHNGLAAGAYLARDGSEDGGARGPPQGRRGGDHGRAVARGARVQGHHLLLRRQPDARAHHRRAASGALRLQGLPDGAFLLRVPRRAFADHDKRGRPPRLRVDGAVLAQGRRGLSGVARVDGERWPDPRAPAADDAAEDRVAAPAGSPRPAEAGVAVPRARRAPGRRAHAAHDHERLGPARRLVRVAPGQGRAGGRRHHRDVGRARVAGDGVRARCTTRSGTQASA